MEDFYGNNYCDFFDIKNILENDLKRLECISNVSGRIKSPESVSEKLIKRNKMPNLCEAMNNLNDIIGLRTVVSYSDDVYKVFDYITDSYEVLNVKDYIKNPKEDGYQSLHVIVNASLDGVHVPVEIQIRTKTQDEWAVWNHDHVYKKIR